MKDAGNAAARQQANAAWLNEKRGVSMLNDAGRNNVAVCVTGQRDCDRLIRAGRELADRLGCGLVVMSALPRLYDEETAKVLEYLYSTSVKADAQMLVMYTDRPMEALMDAFGKHNVGRVVLGDPGRRSSQMGARLMCGYPQADYYALDGSGRACQVQEAARAAL